jgi:hypothetical protein
MWVLLDLRKMMAPLCVLCDCSIDRDVMESANISFKEHIRCQHNMWTYYWYVCQVIIYVLRICVCIYIRVCIICICT